MSTILPQKEFSRPQYVQGIGPSNAKIAIIGEAPGFEEDKKGIPFVGPAGQLLDRLLRSAGITREELYLTNVIKYRPPNNDIKRIAEIGVSLEESIKNLAHELEVLNPNVLVPLGGTALSAVTGRKGITKYRGSVLIANFGQFKTIPSIHPSALLRAESWGEKSTPGEGAEISEQIVIADLIKVKRESLFREIKTTPRKIDICRSSYDLYQFLTSYQNEKEVSVDIETYKGIPICVGLAFTPYHAMSVPLLSLPGLGGGINLSQSELISIYQQLSKFFNRKDVRFIGQNFKYDHDKLICVSRLIDGNLKDKLAADTSLMMGVVYTEFKKSLAMMTSLFTNEPYYKDEGKEFNPKKNKAEDLLIYNAKDVLVTFEIKRALDKEIEEFDTLYPGHNLQGFYYNYVNKLHDLYMDIEAEGLDVDIPRLRELRESYSGQIKERQGLLDSLVGHEINVRSPKQMKELLFRELKLPTRENTQEDTIVALMGNHTIEGSRESKILNTILELRQLRTNNSYLENEPDPDGRIRTTYRITGTETGRTSTGVLGSPIRPWDSGMAFQTIPKHGPFAKSIRSIFIAPPGYVFLEADLSQAEARIVALLSDDDFTLKLFDTVDLHTTTASWLFNCGVNAITPDQRFIGKVVRHAGNYGMGKRRLMLSVNSDAKKFGIPVQLSEKQAGEILNTFHARTPRIRTVFQREVKDEVSRSRTLFNPFGRMRQFFGNLKDEELYAQLPQSTVPDHLRMSGIRIKRRIPNIRICLEAHDAFLFKVLESEVSTVSKVIKEELEREIDFSRCSLPRGRLLIPAELKVGNRYSELKKL